MRLVLLCLLPWVTTGRLECEFLTFRLRAWACEADADLWHAPSPCSRRNPYVPDMFDLQNVSDGTTWGLQLRPERSFEVTHSVKRAVFRFELIEFSCRTLDDYSATVRIRRAQSVQDELAERCSFLLAMVLLAVLLFLPLCCCDRQLGESVATWALLSPVQDDAPHVHFE